jgi:hypothetical protein
MGEQVTQDKSEEMSRELIGRAIEFLKENQSLLMVRLLVADPTMTDKIAKIFVALKRNMYEATIRLEKRSMYGYQYNETEFYINWITSMGCEVDIYIPNKVFLGAVRIEVDDERILQKDVQLEIKMYQEKLKEIVRYLEDMKKDEN